MIEAKGLPIDRNETADLLVQAGKLKQDTEKRIKDLLHERDRMEVQRVRRLAEIAGELKSLGYKRPKASNGAGAQAKAKTA